MTIKEAFKKVDLLQEQLKKLQPLKREDEDRLWKKFRLEWNFNSNNMEGNTLTYGHTELLLILDKVTGDYSGREIEEMKAHDVAVKMLVDMAMDKERDLTESFIRQLNEIILVRPFWKEAITPDGIPTRREITPGEYKKFPNSVRLENGEIFHYASPEETPAFMGDLMNFYNINSVSTEVHPLWLAAMVHYKFVRVHPFDDGNGRVARLLMNYVLMKKGLPPIVIKSTEKKAYLTALNKADIGDLESFVLYIAEQLYWSLEISIKAAEGREIEEKGDLDKRIAMLERDLEAIDVNESLKANLGVDYFNEILQTWVKDLMTKAISGVQKFNKLFKDTQHNLAIINVGSSVNFLDDPANVVYQKFLAEFEKDRDRISKHEAKIIFDARYGPLIKGGLHTFGCLYGFNIQFNTIKYEVFVDEFSELEQRITKSLFVKLLHKPLTPEENDKIVSLLTNAIYEHIDFHSKKNGLR